MQKFKYFISVELKLVIESYFGHFKFEDLFKFKRTEMNDPVWNENYHVLADIRNAEIELTDKDILNLHDYLKNNEEINSERKSAMITDQPGQVVFGTLMEMYNTIKTSLIIPKVFSTLDSALSWLNIDITEAERINGILMKLSAFNQQDI